MIVTLGQQYNVGEKPTVMLYTYINRHAGTPTKHLTKGMVSTNLSRLFYAGEIRNSGNGNVFFLNKWVRFAREDKAVALQYHYQRTNTNVLLVCGGFTFVHALSMDRWMDEHKHSPARICYTNKVLYTTYRNTDRRHTDVVVVVCWLPKFHDF